MTATKQNGRIEIKGTSAAPTFVYLNQQIDGPLKKLAYNTPKIVTIRGHHHNYCKINIF